jgi:nicotinamidase-related amidase
MKQVSQPSSSGLVTSIKIGVKRVAQLTLNPESTALVVIDLQKGITGLPCAPYSGTDVVHNAASLVEAFHKAKGFVALVHVETRDNRDMLSPITDGNATVVKRPPDFAEIVSELGQNPEDHVVAKRQWGAFYGTDLDLQLRRRRIDTIVLCGIATNIGVGMTAREAYQLGYNQVFVENAMTALSREQHEYELKYIFPRIGRIRSTEEVVSSF